MPDRPVLLLAASDGVLTDAQIDLVREAAPGYEVVRTRDQDRIAALLPRVEVAAVSFPRRLLPDAHALRWLQLWSAGADWLLEADLPDGLTVTSASGVHEASVPEHAFALLLALGRNLPQTIRAQDRKQWLRYRPDATETDGGTLGDADAFSAFDLFELDGKTMLLLGTGAIGSRIGQIAQAFGMRVVGVRHDPSKAADGVDEMVGTDALAERLPEADVVMVTLPATPETRGLLDREHVARMKPTAVLVNVGRGEVVDEAALVDALQNGRLAGAGLDVFEEEPLPEGSPLWSMPNVIVSPHAAGRTPQYDRRALALFLDNLRRYESGDDLRNVVDLERGY